VDGVARAPAGAHFAHLFPLACFALTIATFYPGHLSFDSNYQFWQARTGNYANLSPVAMAWAWSKVHALWPGSGGLFVLHLALWWGGVWAIACALFARPGARIAATAFVALATPALLILSHLWTDAALIACLAAAGALLVVADVRRARWPLAFALPLMLYAGLVRHNALPALAPLVVWAGVAFVRARAPDARASRPVLALAVVAFLAVVVVSARAVDRALVPQPVSAFGVVQLFDLAAISIDTNEMLLPAFVRPPDYTLERARERFRRYTAVPLFALPGDLVDGTSPPFSDAELADLRRAWLAAIRDHPRAWLEHRAKVALEVFGRYRKDKPVYLAYVVEAPPFRDNPPVVLNHTSAHRLAIAWYDRAIGWWIYAPATWIVLAVACLPLAWRRRETPAGRCALALAASGLLYVAPLPLIAPSAELRYSGWLFAAASLALVALFVGRRFRLRRA